MCVSMSIQQLAIFGDKLVVRRGKLRQRSRVHVLCSVTMASYGVSIYTVSVSTWDNYYENMAN